MSVKKWDSSLRPREKALKEGFSSLSDYELIALFLRSGTKGSSSLGLSETILSNIGGIKQLENISIKQLMKIKGVGLAKGCELAAVVELAKRINYQKINETIISSSSKLYQWLKDKIGTGKQESFLVLFLNNSNKLLGYEQLFKGGSDSVTIDTQTIFSSAIKNDATKIIIAHNHPSGQAYPSKEDNCITRKIKEAGEIVGIKLIDHMIVCDNGYYSYKENDIL